MPPKPNKTNAKKQPVKKQAVDKQAVDKQAVEQQAMEKETRNTEHIDKSSDVSPIFFNCSTKCAHFRASPSPPWPW